MKHKLSILHVALLAMLMTVPLKVSAITFTAQVPSGQTLTFDGSEGSWTTVSRGSSYPSGDLIIPRYVLHDGVAFYITNIGDFSNCTGLTSVTIEEGTTYPPNFNFVDIEPYAFSNCTGLTSVQLSSRLRTVYANSFDGCTGLMTTDGLIINNILIVPPASATGDYTVPDGIERINGSAFAGRTGLTSVVLPSSLRCIGDYAFAGCTGLTSISLPEGLTTIDDFAFYGCSGITRLAVPSSLVHMGIGAFENTNVDYLLWNADSCVIEGLAGLQSVDTMVIGSSARKIGRSGTNSCLPDANTLLFGASHFEGNCFSDLLEPFSGMTVNTIVISPSVRTLTKGLFSNININGLHRVEIQSDSITVVDNPYNSYSYGVFGIPSLDTLVLADGMTHTPPQLLFNGFYSVRNFYMPASITSIDSNTFSDINSQKVYYGGTMAQWCNIDFANRGAQPARNSILYINGQPIMSYIRVGSDSVSVVTIPDGITTIKKYAFYDIYTAYSKDSISLPASLTSVGEGALDFEEIDAVGYAGTLAQWCNIDFEGDGTLDGRSNPVEYGTRLYVGGQQVRGALTIPSGVTIIKPYTFQYLHNVTSVTIPSSVTAIGGCAFAYCDSIASVDIPNSVNSIGSYAFAACTYVSSITIGSGVRTIGEYAFALCGFDMPSVSVPSTVTSMGEEAFMQHRMLYYSGPATDNYPWGALCVNGYIEDSIYYTSAAKDTVAGCHPLLVNAVIPEGVQAIGDKAFFNQRIYNEDAQTEEEYDASARNSCNVRSVTLPSTLRSIGERAFYRSLIAGPLTLPAGLQSIGESAFYNCDSLTGQIVIPSSVTELGYGAFSSCDNITSAVINASIDTLRRVFGGCSNLATVHVGGTVTYIDNGAFGYSSGLRTVTLSNQVTGIGQRAFQYSNLRSISLPGSLTYIGPDAFGYSKLQSVIIPNSVTYVGHGAFDNCKSLKTAVVGDGVDTLQENLFVHCDSLRTVTVGSGVVHMKYQAFYCNNDTLEVIMRTSTPPTLEAYTFRSSYIMFYVPCGTAASYQNAWSGSYYFSNYGQAFVGQAMTTFSAVSNNPAIGSVYIDQMPNCSDNIATVRAVPAEGCRFLRWSDGSTDNPYVLTASDGMTLTAFFSDTCHVVLLSSDDAMGSVSGGGNYHWGETVTISATPVAHHHFVSWSDGDRTNPRQLQVDMDTTLTAFFGIDTHYVNVTPSDMLHGNVTGGGYYVYGTPCTVEATAYTGYTFLRWSNGVTATPYTFAVVADMELVAEFVPEGADIFYITVESNDPSKGSVSGGGPFAAGMTTTISATPFEGNYFARWQDNDTHAVRNIVVTADMTYTAYFVANGDTLGIGTAALAPVAIYAQTGSIVVVGAEGMTVSIFDITGRQVHHSTGDTRTPALPSGIYMVRIGTHPARKVAIVR